MADTPNSGELIRIVDLQLERLRAQLLEQGMHLDVSLEAREKLGTDGFDAELGARPLKRLVQKELQDLLADAILSGELVAGDLAEIDLNDGTYRLSVRRRELEAPALPAEPTAEAKS